MESVNSPVTDLSFIPAFTSNQESENDKNSFETSVSSVNCFGEVVVSQSYSDISRNEVTLGASGGPTFSVNSSDALTCTDGVLHNSAAVVTVPESQLFTIQSNQVNVMQHEADNDENMTGGAANVDDVHVELSINVNVVPSAGVVLTDGVPSTSTPTDSKKRKGGWPKGKKRKKEFADLNKPKAPITGYVRFINSRRAEVKQQHPHLTFPEITKLLGLEWSNLLQEEKQKYLDEAEEDKKRYIEELKIYQQSEQYQAFVKRQSARKIKGGIVEDWNDSGFTKNWATEARDVLETQMETGRVDAPEEVPSNLLLGEQMVDDTNDLFCRVCNQFFSSLHNKKEHLFGKQHLLMLTGEFEREAEQNASGSEKILNDTPDLAVADSGHVDRNASLLANPTEAIVSIAQFTEKFLEQNLNRELELRELRKIVLLSQAENISLNKEMEELKDLLQKVEDDLGSVKAYGASLTAQLNSLRMVPTLFGVINF